MKLLSAKGVVREDVEEAPGSAPASLISPDLHRILYYGSLAPSGHNAQPWSVRLDEGQVWIGTDSARWLPQVDPTNREVTLSIGAFVENLITAAPAHGFVADYEVVGTRPAGDLIRLVLKPVAQRDVSLERLRARRTLRNGQLRRELSTPDVKALCAEAGVQHVHFIPSRSREGRLLAEATLEANRLQTSRDDAQSELADWMRWTAADGLTHRNGFTPEALEMTGFAGWYVRRFMNRKGVLGKNFRRQSLDRVRQQVASCGGWIIITSEDEDVPGLIDAGRRCERMWLHTRARSVAVHPMSQVLEEAPLKDHIMRDLGLPGRAQFVLRVGYVRWGPANRRMRISCWMSGAIRCRRDSLSSSATRRRKASSRS
jgi:hypothetical protein